MTDNNKRKLRFDMVVIGASTGGPQAVKNVLKELPADFPVGIVYVQHTETSVYGQFAEWLNHQTDLAVRLARNDDYPSAGEVLVAPGGHHILFRGGKLVLEDTPPVMNIRPCVDYLFMSAAEQFGKRLIGLIMSGMGSDGARGCQEIVARGGFMIAQDKESSVIFGMARAAAERNGVSLMLPLDKISDQLKDLVSY